LVRETVTSSLFGAFVVTLTDGLPTSGALTFGILNLNFLLGSSSDEELELLEDFGSLIISLVGGIFFVLSSESDDELEFELELVFLALLSQFVAFLITTSVLPRSIVVSELLDELRLFGNSTLLIGFCFD